MKCTKINAIIILIINCFMGFLYPQSEYKRPNRRMIMLFENLNDEKIEKTLNSSYNNNMSEFDPPQPAGVGAITGAYLVAMHQQAAPIFVSKTIIINALEHKKLFNDFVNLDIKQLKQKYSNKAKFSNIEFLKKFKDICVYTSDRYNQINKEIELFINKNNITNENSNNFINQIQSKIVEIVKNKNFNIANSPFLLNDKFNKNCNMAYVEMFLSIIINTIAYDNWLIKEVSNNLCLLIPKKYLDNISINHKDIRFKNRNNRLKNKLTKLEVKLGLRVNHLKDLSFNNLINKQYFNSEFNLSKLNLNDYQFNIINSMKNLFVNKKYAKDIIWSFYCAGHGYYESNEKIFLPQLKKLKKYYRDKLKSKCLRRQKQRYLRNIDLINYEIQKIEHARNYNNYIVNNIDLADGAILSMSKEDFTNTLLFLNNNINTAFLYYTSCYAGGDHLIKPYMHNNKPLIFNYDIVSGTICENMSIQLMPVLRIPPYYHINNKINISKDHIDFKNKKIKISTSLIFDDFFNKLETSNYKDPQILKYIAKSLHPYEFDYKLDKKDGSVQNICNTPLIRFKDTDTFKVSPFQDENISIINSEFKLSTLDKNVNLLYSDYIPQTLHINNKYEAIISMLPGFAGHVFENICAPNLDFKDIVKPFLYFEEIPAPKLFWIKKLKCKNTDKLINNQDVLELNNVIIIRNIINTDKLKNMNRNTGPATAYIYFDNNMSENSFYKIRCPKYCPELDFKTQIKLCKYKSNARKQSYKNEIFALKPNLKSYINDVKSKFA